MQQVKEKSASNKNYQHQKKNHVLNPNLINQTCQTQFRLNFTLTTEQTPEYVEHYVFKKQATRLSLVTTCKLHEFVQSVILQIFSPFLCCQIGNGQNISYSMYRLYRTTHLYQCEQYIVIKVQLKWSVFCNLYINYIFNAYNHRHRKRIPFRDLGLARGGFGTPYL